MRQHVTFAVTVIYVWAMMVLLGSVALETFMIYPNVFHDVPDSLDEAQRFMAVATPRDYFPPLGFACWAAGAASLALCWPLGAARYWILGSLAVIVGDGLVSMAFFWPRNRVMFTEGSAVHSVDVLRRAAWEFQAGHWGRFSLSAVGSALAFTGLLRLHGWQVIGRHGRARKMPNALVAVLVGILIAVSIGCSVGVAAEASQPKAQAVSAGRLGSAAGVLVGLTGVLAGGRALRSACRIGTGAARGVAVVALVAGLAGTALGGLVVATAGGAAGTGNGVGGAIAALVAGPIGMVLGGLALARRRRSGGQEQPQTR